MQFKQIDIDKLTPADYNPRFLSDQKKELLKKSICELGMIFPLVVFKREKDYLLLGGHQRTKAMKELGYKTAPCFVIENLNEAQEKKFNQYHNEVELANIMGEEVVITDPIIGDYSRSEVIFDLNRFIKNRFLMHRARVLSQMLTKWDFNMSILIPKSEKVFEVIFGLEYLVGCKIAKIKPLVLILDKEKGERAKYFFSQQFGEFNYDGLRVGKSFVQSEAQISRSIRRSVTYNKVMLPMMGSKIKDKSFIDIFCGYAHEVDRLKRQFGTQKIANFELFIRSGKGFNVFKTKLLVRDSLKKYQENQGFDIVVMDSVLNSVQSLELEQDVINTCLGFAKVGADIFMSGRLKPSGGGGTAGDSVKLHVEDKEGFCADIARGEWFFQRFYRNVEHFKNILMFDMDQSKRECIKIVKIYVFSSQVVAHIKKIRKPSHKEKNSIIASIKREFDLKIGETSLGLGDKVVEVIRRWI